MKHPLVRLFEFLRPVRKLALLSCVLLTARVSMEVLTIYLLSPLITEISSSLPLTHSMGFWEWIASSEPSAVHLRSVLEWMAAAQLALGILTYLRTVQDARFSLAIVKHVRSLVYDHLQHLAFSFYDRMTNGKLISRALQDIDTLHAFLNMSLLLTVEIVFSIAAYLALLFIRSPILVLVALAPMPIWLFVIFRMARRSHPLYLSQNRAWDDLMTTVTENMAGRHVIKAFGTEPIEQTKYEITGRNFLQRIYAVISFQSRFIPTMHTMAAGANIAMFMVCSWLIQIHKLPVGDLMILGAAMATILGKLEQIRQISEAYQKAMAAGERVFEILDAPRPDHLEKGIGQLVVKDGNVEFDHVCFGYIPNKPILHDIHAVIPGRSVTALVGPTGGGKSTLAALIARFYDPQSGEIRIDGQPIRTANLHLLRQHVGIVFQETFLFTRSIRDNIRYGRKDVSEEMLVAAAVAAHADEFIRTLPQGYDTPIGGEGVQLSGGQRQRLALARALVYDPAILILDDATAALDASTEFEIQRRLRSVFAGRTVLMITHRTATLALADQVLVLDHGRITQAGTHQELMASPGHYRQLLEDMSSQETPDRFTDEIHRNYSNDQGPIPAHG